AQNWHWPHEGDQFSTTGSPTATSATPSPTSTTVPAPSCPSTAGTGWRSVPLDSDRSEWQTPAAASRTRTFPGPVGGSTTSATVIGAPISVNTTALGTGGLPGKHCSELLRLVREELGQPVPAQLPADPGRLVPAE